MGEGAPLCGLYKRSVTKFRGWYDVRESMRWIRSHIVFEHSGDPSCPWRHIEVFRRTLEQPGYDPDEVVFRVDTGEDP